MKKSKTKLIFIRTPGAKEAFKEIQNTQQGLFSKDVWNAMKVSTCRYNVQQCSSEFASSE